MRGLWWGAPRQTDVGLEDVKKFSSIFLFCLAKLKN